MIVLEKLKAKLDEFSKSFKDPITNESKFTWEELDALYEYSQMGYWAAYNGEPKSAPKHIDDKYKWLFWMYGWESFQNELKQEELAP